MQLCLNLCIVCVLLRKVASSSQVRSFQGLVMRLLEGPRALDFEKANTMTAAMPQAIRGRAEEGCLKGRVNEFHVQWKKSFVQIGLYD